MSTPYNLFRSDRRIKSYNRKNEKLKGSVKKKTIILGLRYLLTFAHIANWFKKKVENRTSLQIELGHMSGFFFGFFFGWTWVTLSGVTLVTHVLTRPWIPVWSGFLVCLILCIIFSSCRFYNTLVPASFGILDFCLMQYQQNTMIWLPSLMSSALMTWKVEVSVLFCFVIVVFEPCWAWAEIFFCQVGTNVWLIGPGPRLD